MQVKSFDGTAALNIDGDSADSVGGVSLNGPNFGSVSLTAGGPTTVSADTDISHISGAADGGFILSAFNVVPPDPKLVAGDVALWLDKTNGACKLMVKAKQADGTVKTAAIALA
jgi:hypothetical protein